MRCSQTSDRRNARLFTVPREASWRRPGSLNPRRAGGWSPLLTFGGWQAIQAEAPRGGSASQTFLKSSACSIREAVSAGGPPLAEQAGRIAPGRHPACSRWPWLPFDTLHRTGRCRGARQELRGPLQLTGSGSASTPVRDYSPFAVRGSYRDPCDQTWIRSARGQLQRGGMPAIKLVPESGRRDEEMVFALAVRFGSRVSPSPCSLSRTTGSTSSRCRTLDLQEISSTRAVISTGTYLEGAARRSSRTLTFDEA